MRGEAGLEFGLEVVVGYVVVVVVFDEGSAELLSEPKLRKEG